MPATTRQVLMYDAASTSRRHRLELARISNLKLPVHRSRARSRRRALNDRDMLGIFTFRAALAAISAALVITQVGCATSSGNPPYPSEWASIKSTPRQDGCPDLQGTYANQGTETFPPEAGTPLSLTEIFTAMARSKSVTGPAAWKRSWPALPPDVVWVSIDQMPETMTITFIDSTGRRTPLGFRRYRFNLSEDRVDDLFGCKTQYDEPTLRFFNEPMSHASTSVVAAGGGGTTVALLKSLDGSLVVNWRSDSIALTLFVLGSGYRVDNLWFRYANREAERPAER
jgi:hypothetical protein